MRRNISVEFYCLILALLYGPAECASPALEGMFPVISVRDDNGSVWKLPNVNGDTNVICREIKNKEYGK